ncbi:MAG: hypothetical protein RJB62_1776, partial [Pseudomonadota bacterium]
EIHADGTDDAVIQKAMYVHVYFPAAVDAAGIDNGEICGKRNIGCACTPIWG